MSLSATAPIVPSAERSVRLSRKAVGWPNGIAVALMAAGVAIWFVSLPAIALPQMTDVGLASVLSAGTWISLMLVTAGGAIAWWYESEALMVTGVLVTIFVLFGLGVLGEPTMRFATTWTHVGIANYIATHGSVNPNIDAYFNWPGFFILSAFISKVAGLSSIEPIARAAPLFYNVMYLLPLVSIGRSLFNDRRLVWLGVWLFFVNNWIGQDYYSPQGLGFFLYLVLIAVLLRWFKGIPRSGQPTTRWSRFPLTRFTRRLSGRTMLVADIRSTGSQRVLLIAAITMITISAVASHQLTPFSMVAGTTAVCLVGWCRLRTLPLGILLITLIWAGYVAVPYLFGHLPSLAGSVGALNSTVTSNVGGRLHGSAGHEFIVKLRLITTAVLWSIAALGFLKRARAGQLNLGLLALAVAPFPLLALQSYGGEALLRIALFTMPFMAFSAACLFMPTARERPPSRAALVALACFAALLIASFPFNRYGNERMDYFSKAELAGVQAMYRLAPDGSYLFSADDSLPWRYEKYAEYYYYYSLTGGSREVNVDLGNAHQLARQLGRFTAAPRGTRSYIIITRSTNAESDLFGPWKRGAQLRLRRILFSSPLFRVVYRNPDAAVFELLPQAGGSVRRATG